MLFRSTRSLRYGAPPEFWANPLKNKITCPVPKLTEAGYTVQVPSAVQWGELDINKHVNNVVYYRWAETARIYWMERVGMSANGHGIGPIMASLNMNFKKPLNFPDEIALGCKCSQLDLESGKFILTHAVYSQEYDSIVATGDGVIVCYDYDSWKRVRRVPDEWLKKVVELDGEGILVKRK